MSRSDYAIENHRKMWNWIADAYESEMWNRIADAYESGVVPSVGQLKQKYLDMTGNENILGNCFLCDYAGSSPGDSNYAYDCSKCLLDWGTPSNSSVTEGFCMDRLYLNDEDGLYGQLIGLVYSKPRDFKEKSDIARKIANLPVRSDTKTIHDESEEISNE